MHVDVEQCRSLRFQDKVWVSEKSETHPLFTGVKHLMALYDDVESSCN